MRGIARTDRLVRLVMWGALLSAAWILFNPGKASASEHPVDGVVRSTTSLTGAVLDVAAPPSKTSSARHLPSRPKPATVAAPVIRDVPRALPPNVIKAATTVAAESAPEPALKPVVAATAHSVGAVVDHAVETVTATAGVVPGLDRPVREVTDVVVDVADTLPVVGSQPVVELPLPGLVPPSTPLPSMPSSQLPPPVGSTPSPVVPTRDQRDDVAASLTSSGGRRPTTDVTADPARNGPVAQPAHGSEGLLTPTSPGGGATAPSLPWLPDLPAPAAPAPAQSSAGSAGQPHGPDVQADLPFATSLSGAAAAAIHSNDRRALGALNPRPGPRPD
jgi:hypothetical protein